MQEMTREHMAMRLFHLTEVNSAPMTIILGLHGNVAGTYLNLLGDELPLSLRRDLMRLNAFTHSGAPEALLVEHLLTHGDGGVVSWALDEAWNYDNAEVEELFGPHLDPSDLLYGVIHYHMKTAQRRFQRLIMDSGEFTGELDSWGNVHGESFTWNVSVGDSLGHVGRMGRKAPTITGPMLRERLRFIPAIENKQLNGENILTDILQFIERSNRTVPHPLYRTPDPNEIWDNGYHDVFNEENLDTVERLLLRPIHRL